VRLWITAIVALLLLFAAPAEHVAAEVVDAQTMSSLVDDDALFEYVLAAEPRVDDTVRAPAADDRPLPSLALGRVFRPPRHSFD
jgi:hypothetical protein